MPAATQAAVLVSSRRRCCICYGLNRDTGLKSGQIAHLDKNNANNAESNLAFLCFTHHDEFDSTASQRKNFTIAEVRQYKSELVQALGLALNQKVHFGEVSVPASDPYAGKYIRVGSESDSSEIIVTPVPDSNLGEARYVITGFALYGIDRESGPNMGTLEFLAAMDEPGQLIFSRDTFGYGAAITTLNFHDSGSLSIEEININGQYGFNVSFGGEYQRA